MKQSFLKENGGFLMVLATIILVRVFLLTPVTVSGHSMDPTYENNQKLMGVNYSSIDRFDVVSFNAPDQPGKMYLKRVIGLPGETVEIKDEQLYIDGQLKEQPFLTHYQQEFAENKLKEAYAYDEYYQKLASEAEHFTADFKMVVPEGDYCVMGDNRLISHDSRSADVGAIAKEAIKSEIKVVYWPLKAIGLAD